MADIVGAAMDIRTKTIELALLPLVNQINTLVNSKSEFLLDQHQVELASQSILVAVERFAAAGLRAVTADLQSKDATVVEACKDARDASVAISSLCTSSELGRSTSRSLREQLVRQARLLLSAVARVLVFADTVIVQDIIATKQKVAASLDHVTQIASFSEFVPGFSLFGEEMVEFGRLTGERQNDLKKEMDVAKMACIRGFIEKSTAILLVSCKACLRHHAAATAEALETREKARQLMHGLLDDVETLISYSPRGPAGAAASAVNANGTPSDKPLLSHSFQSITELLKAAAALHGATAADLAEQVASAFQAMEDTMQEFTDSANMLHENREGVLQHSYNAGRLVKKLADLAPLQHAEDDGSGIKAEYIHTVEEAAAALEAMYKQVVEAARVQAIAAGTDQGVADGALLSTLLTAAQTGDDEYVDTLVTRLADRNDQIIEACRLLQHVAIAESHAVRAECISSYLASVFDILKLAARVLTQNASSRTAEENFETVRATWTAVVHELLTLAHDVCGDASQAVGH